MPHLVGDVVDGEEVAGRSRETRATGGLGRAADDAELGNSAAGLPEPTVAEVVVARADDLADDDAVTPEIRAPDGLGHGETAHCAAGPVRRDRLGIRVEIEEIVVRDQLQPDREVVVVNVRDTVHQGDLRGGHVPWPAVVRRVGRVADQRGAIRPQEVARRGELGHLDRQPGGLDHGVVVRVPGVLGIPDEVAGVDARRAGDVVRVDVPVAVCRADRGPEAERGQVSVDRRRQIRDASSAIGLDPGMAPGQAGRHDRRLLECEPVE